MVRPNIVGSLVLRRWRGRQRDLWIGVLERRARARRATFAPTGFYLSASSMIGVRPCSLPAEIRSFAP